MKNIIKIFVIFIILFIFNPLSGFLTDSAIDTDCQNYDTIISNTTAKATSSNSIITSQIYSDIAFLTNSANNKEEIAPQEKKDSFGQYLNINKITANKSFFAEKYYLINLIFAGRNNQIIACNLENSIYTRAP